VTRNGKVRLADFGIVTDLTGKINADPLALASTFTGTLGYMCPSRLRGKPYNFKCDIWALAIVLMSLTATDNCQNLVNGVFGKDPTFWGMMEQTADNNALQAALNINIAKRYVFISRLLFSNSLFTSCNLL